MTVMEVSELMIGNIVDKGIVHGIRYKHGILGCDIAITKFQSFAKWIDYRELEAVPLTEDLLTKMNYGYWVDEDEWYSPDDDATIRINHWTSGDKIGFFECGYGIKLEFVHQLQNLHFALIQKKL